MLPRAARRRWSTRQTSPATSPTPTAQPPPSLFDGLGGIISETDGRGNTTTITRNSQDLPTVIVDPLNRTTTIAYDSSGNPTTITQADGVSETILYNDSFGIPTHVVDFDGNVTTYTLDGHGNVTQRTDPDGQSENYTYNSAGQMLTDTDPLGKTVTYTYDSLGRLVNDHRARHVDRDDPVRVRLSRRRHLGDRRGRRHRHHTPTTRWAG